MITFIASQYHTGALAALRGEILAPLTPPTRAITYETLFSSDRLKPGSYVFTDLERLHPSELRLAARFYRQMQAMPGFRVLNDPARVRTRYGLLRALAEAGVNDFDAYCADGLPKPKRFPVFLRIASDHAGPIGDLIEDQAELDSRLDALEAEGIPLVGVLVVEFCGERNAHGHFEKLSFYKVGDRITLSALLIGGHWNVKRAEHGTGLVTPEIEREQIAALKEDRFAETMRNAFDIAAIDYGRADVGFSGGRIQVYEINTNPTIHASSEHASGEHRDSRQLFHARLGSMLHEINLPGGDPVPFDLGALDAPSKNRLNFAKWIKQQMLDFPGR